MERDLDVNVCQGPHTPKDIVKASDRLQNMSSDGTKEVVLDTWRSINMVTVYKREGARGKEYTNWKHHKKLPGGLIQRVKSETLSGGHRPRA